MMAANVCLRPDRQLLDPHFEGYKLSLDPLPTYQHVINSVICQADQSDSQLSLQHFRIFGLHNRLYSDPWHENYIYYVTERQFINQIKLKQFGFEDSHVVCHIPSECQIVGEYNESIHFTSPHQIIIGDGRGALYLAMTDDRNTAQQWKIAFSDTIDQEKKPFLVVHSRLTSEFEIDCLLLNAEEGAGENKKNPFLTVLTWITLATDANGIWAIKHKRQLAGVGPVDFAALKDNTVMVVSGHQFEFIYDSCKPIEKEPAKVETKSERPQFEWTQTLEDITITFRVANTLNKDDITVDITSLHLKVETSDGSVSFNEELAHEIDASTVTWNLENEKLKISLLKCEASKIWQSLDKEGKKLLDPNALVSMGQDLAAQTPLFDSKPPFDPNQLEECDAYPSDFFNLSIYDSQTHKIATQVNLSGNQWLFSIVLHPDELPAFCTRHDVDGVVWQPREGNEFVHMFTLNAFGYVQASKQDKKFSLCSPDGSFAIISDSRRHVYVYYRPSAVSSEVRNRRTGQRVTSVARQQVINLDSPDEIIGIHASTNSVFVLTKHTLFAVRVHGGEAEI